MERVLLWLALLLGPVLWFAAVSTARARTGFARSPISPALPGVLAFLFSLPASKPFSAGIGLGWGLLLGGVCGALSIWGARRTLPGRTLLAGAALAPTALALPHLILRHTLTDSLMGVALGWLAAVLVDRILPGEPDAEMERPIEAGVTIGAILATTLALACLLGAFRDGIYTTFPKGVWGIFALALATQAIGVAFLFDRAGNSLSRPVWLPHALSLFAMALFARLLSLQLMGKYGQPFFLIAAASVPLWLVVRPLFDSEDADSGRGRALLGALLLLTAGLVSAHLGAGYGVAVLAVTLTAGAVLLPPKNPAPLAALAFVALLAAHRLFAHQGLNDIRNFGLSEQYALLGIVVGAALPALCARLAARHARNVFGPVVAATPLLFAPVAISALYGPRAALAVFLGLIVAAVPGLSGATNKRLAPAGLFALAAALALTQIFPRFAEIADLTRVDRLKLAGVLLAIAAAILAVAEAVAFFARKPDVSTKG